MTLEERTVGGLHAALLEDLPETLQLDDPILDLGCGSGAWLSRLAGQGYSNLTGVDRDGSAWGGVPGAQAQVMDLDAADWPLIAGAPFKLITAIEVIEHVSAPGLLLRHIAELLHPDGHAIVTTPNMHALAARLRFLLTDRLKSFDNKGDPTHVAPMFIEPLQRLCTRAGLEATQIWCYPRLHSLTTHWPLRFAAAALDLCQVNNSLPGDSLCLLLRHSRAATQVA